MTGVPLDCHCYGFLLMTDGFSFFCFVGCGITYLAMMPGQIPDPSLTAGALPGLGPLTGLPGTTLTAEELKYADIRSIGAIISPMHFLEVKLGKRPQPVKTEVSFQCIFLNLKMVQMLFLARQMC